jgi:eukaryotic-like serine/threonine-protein kinase
VHPAVPKLPLVIGRYHIDRTLGRGANSAVYGAHRFDDGAAVALKLFHEGVEASAPARVAREATIAQGVHPNVVRTLEVGRWEGRRWLAMEMLDGPTLSDWLHGLPRRVLIREALRIAQGVAAGLESLHGAGIVHRDLGPANIVLAGGRAYLIDLGSARRIGAMGTVHTLRASPGCLPPERLLGDSACSPAEDMWALGVLLYRMTAGRHPFEASSTGAMMNRVLRCHPCSVRESRPNVPTALSLLILKLLAKHPESRPTVTDARRVLTRWRV